MYDDNKKNINLDVTKAHLPEPAFTAPVGCYL